MASLAEQCSPYFSIALLPTSHCQNDAELGLTAHHSRVICLNSGLMSFSKETGVCLSPFLTSFILDGRGPSTHSLEDFDLPPSARPPLCCAVLQASGREAEH